MPAPWDATLFLEYRACLPKPRLRFAKVGPGSIPASKLSCLERVYCTAPLNTTTGDVHREVVTLSKKDNAAAGTMVQASNLLEFKPSPRLEIIRTELSACTYPGHEQRNTFTRSLPWPTHISLLPPVINGWSRARTAATQELPTKVSALGCIIAGNNDVKKVKRLV